MLLRLARWFLRLLGRLDLVVLELGGDATRAWVSARGETGPLIPVALARIRPFHPAHFFLKSLTEHEGEGRYRLTGDQVWAFLDRLAGRRTPRMEATSAVAWKKTAPEPLDVEVACDPAGPWMTVRYLGDAQWARGRWMRRGDAWWDARLTDEHAEIVLKREATFGPERLRRALTEFAPGWKVRGAIWTVDPKRSLTRTAVEPAEDGSLTVRCEYVVPRDRLRPLAGDPGWAYLEGAIVPLPQLPPTPERALREGPVRLDPGAAADFLAGEGAGLLPGAQVLAKSVPVLTARPDGDDLLLEPSFVWGEGAFASAGELANRAVVRRGMNWCRIDTILVSQTHEQLAAGLKRAFVDARPEGARLRLRGDDVPEFLAFGGGWFPEWKLLAARGAPPIVRGPSRALLRVVRAPEDGLGCVGLDVTFEVGGLRVPLAELAPRLAEGTRWIRRDGRWIEFDRGIVARILERVPPRAPLDRPLRIDAHDLRGEAEAWKALGDVTVEADVSQRRALIDGGRAPTQWPKSISVSSEGAMRIYSWLEACTAIGVSPVAYAPTDRDLIAAVAALVVARRDRGGRGPILVVAGAKRTAAWTAGLPAVAPVRTLVLRRKAPSQEEVAAADVLLVAPNSLDTAVYRSVDAEWPLLVFDQVDRTFATDESKLFRTAASMRARVRVGALSDRGAVAKAPKMRALRGVLYPGVEEEPVSFVAPFSFDPERGGHLIQPAAAPGPQRPAGPSAPSAAYLAWRDQWRRGVPTIARPDFLRRHACEILNLEEDADAKRSIARLQALWRTYRGQHPRIDETMIDWIADLYYLHVGPEAGLAWQWKQADLLPAFSEIDLLMEKQVGRAPVAAWRRLAGVRPGGKFYEMNRERVDAACQNALDAAAPCAPDPSYRVRRILFRGAAVRTGIAREIVIGRARRWSALAPQIAAILKRVEAELRGAPPEAAKPAEVRIVLDFAAVDRLKKESAAVAEILAAPEDAPVAVEEEKIEPIRAADGRLLYASLLQVRALWRDLDFASRQIVTDVHRGSVRNVRELEIQLRPTGKMPLAALESINERATERLGDAILAIEGDALSVNEEFRDEMEVVVDGKVAAAEEADPYRALVGKLAEPERALVSALAAGPLPSAKVDEILRPHGLMAALAVDRINEKAQETVGDNVLASDGAGVSVEEEDLEPLRAALK